ncbi:MAG: LptF/LptG family permease, partial [Sulfurimonas sp.]
MFVLPDILFYTLPISFFVAAVLSIFKLSNDNEIVVLFALGIKPSFLVKTLFTPALLLSILLFIDYFMLYPHTNNLSDNFIDQKKSEAKFNLSASEFGNNFGPWLLYIGKEDKEKKRYEDVFLFNKENDEEVLISAKQADLINTGGVLKLELTSGEGYSYSKEKFTQVNFDQMTIFDTLKASLKEYEMQLLEIKNIRLEYLNPQNRENVIGFLYIIKYVTFSTFLSSMHPELMNRAFSASHSFKIASIGLLKLKDHMSTLQYVQKNWSLVVFSPSF